jgi:hypothetical protein
VPNNKQKMQADSAPCPRLISKVFSHRLAVAIFRLSAFALLESSSRDMRQSYILLYSTMHSSCLFLLLISLAVLSTAQFSTAVKIQNGTINGAKCTASDAIRFLKIPFAQPPTGDLRFAPPQPYSGGYPGGTLDATSEPVACIQFGGPLSEPGPSSEDW